MRYVQALIALTMLASCASSQAVDSGPRPPEGPTSAGTDFGFWNRDSDGSVDQAFRVFISRRYDIADVAKAKKDLTADLFECKEGAATGRPGELLDCNRLYCHDDFCHTWSVEFREGDRDPRAHYTRTAMRNPVSETARSRKSRRQPGGS